MISKTELDAVQEQGEDEDKLQYWLVGRHTNTKTNTNTNTKTNTNINTKTNTKDEEEL